jgi:centrin-3
MSKDSPTEIEEAFKAFDIDDTGYMTLENLKQISIELGEELSDETLREMMAEANKMDEAKQA